MNCTRVAAGTVAAAAIGGEVRRVSRWNRCAAAACVDAVAATPAVAGSEEGNEGGSTSAAVGWGVAAWRRRCRASGFEL